MRSLNYWNQSNEYRRPDPDDYSLLAARPRHRRAVSAPVRCGTFAPTTQSVAERGWGVLIISIAPAILARGWIFGPILWIAAVMAGAGVAFLSLNLIVSQSPPR
ncbi:DUF3325 family protein [Sphingomonas sp. LR55]|uniref:DUF3325 family protein n=1 Tax=Sphingomonas sp. LR55 TaxID=3050231 RepID=UPI003FA6CC95